MSELVEIKNLIETLGYDIVGVNLASDRSITVSLIKTKFGDIGKRKTIYVPSSVNKKEYTEIFSYVCEKSGIPKKES